MINVAQMRNLTGFQAKLLAFVALVLIWLIVPRNLTIHALRGSYAADKNSTMPVPASNTTVASLATSDRVAVIIEGRPLANLIPVILHFSSVLGPTWPIVLYASPSTMVTTSAPLERAISEGRVTIRQIPATATLDSHAAVSRMLISPWLWEELAPASHVLLFQTDSILCSNSPQKVEDFLQWDFVGAPIRKGLGVGYNGGLSLRRRSKMLLLAHMNEQRGPSKESPPYEDQWVFTKLKELQLQGVKVQLPSEDEAAKFAVETVYKQKPLGYHQVSRWQPDKMQEVEAWCPEIKLTIGGGLHPGHKNQPPPAVLSP